MRSRSPRLRAQNLPQRNGEYGRNGDSGGDRAGGNRSFHPVDAGYFSEHECLSVIREPWDFMITADSMTAILFMRPSA